MNTIREYAVQGKSVRAIARELGLSRNSVRKVLRRPTPAPARPHRASMLDPYAEQIRQWVAQDHLLNCQTMLGRLRAQGYTGQISILKAFVHPLRPLVAGMRQPVVRYENRPGEQLQFDIRNFKISCMVDRGQISQQIAGIQSERVEASGGEARGRPYDLDTCGSLPRAGGVQNEAQRPPFGSVPMSLSLHLPYWRIRMPVDRPGRVALAQT